MTKPKSSDQPEVAYTNVTLEDWVMAETTSKDTKRVRNVDPQLEGQELTFPLGQPITSDPENPYRNQVRPLDAEGELVPAGSVMHRVAREPITVEPGGPIPSAVVKREGKTPAAVASTEGTEGAAPEEGADAKKR
jgi:hypothetical protein